MTKLEIVEKSVAALSPEEIQEFAVWFADFHADLWDQQIADDATAGRLDKLVDQALAHHRAGRTTPL